MQLSFPSQFPCFCYKKYTKRTKNLNLDGQVFKLIFVIPSK